MAAKRLQSFMDLSQGRAKEANDPVLPEISAPSVQVTNRFLFQSYFDDTLLEKAILVAAPNEPIISSTAKRETIPGYTVGLHPSSECPVAIQFEIGGQPSSSSAITLIPGQILRPHGLPHGMKSGGFSGFTWGLPFGWLGGGLANLHVFSTPDADSSWPGRPEVIFHRQRMKIVSVGAAPGNSLFNWPTRFPWPLAFNNQTIVQRNQSIISIEPTRFEMMLRMTALPAVATMRFVMQGTDAFALNSAGVAVLTASPFYDYIWGTYPASGVAGNLGTNYEIDEISAGPIPRLGVNNSTGGGVTLVDLTGTLAGQYVDIVRYGRL